MIALKEIARRFAIYHCPLLGLMLVLVVRLLPRGLTAGVVVVLERVRLGGRR